MSEPDDVAAALIAGLADDGEQVDEGGFTLDPAKAREKLRAYQLADPREWILLAIAAGHVATDGRGPVRASWGASAAVWFEGLALSAAELERCFAAVLGGERDREGEALRRARVQRLLGLAGNAALSLGDVELEIECLAEGERRRLRVRSDAAQEFEREPVGDRIDAPELRIRARGARDRRAPEREYDLVHERCRYASMPLLLDGELLGRGPRAAFVEPLERAEIRVAGELVGEAALEREGAEPARALIINRSVLVETLTLDGCLPGFVAIVHVDLPMDLSQRQLLRSEAFAELLAAIRAAAQREPQASGDRARDRATARADGPRPPR